VSDSKKGIYISRNGKTFGPYPNDLLIQYIQTGLVFETDYIYLTKQKKWEKIAVVYEQTLIEEHESIIQESKSEKGEVLELELRKEYEAEALVDSIESTFSPSLKESPIKPLSDWLGIDNKELVDLSENAVSAYKPFPIHRDGKKDRWIEAPNERLKGVQRLILDRLLINIPLNGAAHGFVPKRSILTHASQHRRKRWVVSLDIRSFFPSVSRERVREVAEELPIPKEDIKHFVNLTTRNDHLPQGAPTSPTLGNLVLRELDKQLCNLVRGTGWFYTRYADDLTFSGFKKPKDILQEASRLIRDDGFSISDEKSRIRGKEQRQMVTGIVVNDKLALCREKRNLVRSMRYRLHRGEIPHHEMNYVLGWINFANHVERSNQSMPISGSTVRSSRISFSKICLALNMMKEGSKPEEIIRFLGISRSSYYRAKKSNYIRNKLRSLYLEQDDIDNACQLIESGEIQEAIALVQKLRSKF
jgi:RNA-directed DNA polymerase